MNTEIFNKVFTPRSVLQTNSNTRISFVEEYEQNRTVDLSTNNILYYIEQDIQQNAELKELYGMLNEEQTEEVVQIIRVEVLKHIMDREEFTI